MKNLIVKSALLLTIGATSLLNVACWESNKKVDPEVDITDSTKVDSSAIENPDEAVKVEDSVKIKTEEGFEKTSVETTEKKVETPATKAAATTEE